MMVLARWFTHNWADTDEQIHADLRPVDLPIPATAALHRIAHQLQNRPRWQVELIEGKPAPHREPSQWPWIHWKEAFWARLSGSPREEAFRAGPGWPNAGWLAATRRSWMARFIDDVLVWLEATAGGCRVHARSRSRLGRGDLGQNRRNLLDLFCVLEELRRSG